MSTLNFRRVLGALLGVDSESSNESFRGPGKSIGRRALAGILGVSIEEYVTIAGRSDSEKLDQGRSGIASSDSQLVRDQEGVSANSDQSEHREAHLDVSRISSYDIMRYSFILSLIAVACFMVAVAALYVVLSATAQLAPLQEYLQTRIFHQPYQPIPKWFTPENVFGIAAVLSSAGLIVITVVATAGAVLYNRRPRILGGIEITLRETIILRPGKTVRSRRGDFAATATDASVGEDGIVEVRLVVDADAVRELELQPGGTFSVRDQTWRLNRVMNPEKEDWKAQLVRIG